MALKARDGSEFTNQRMVNKQNMRLDSQAPTDTGDGAGGDQPKDIQSDPEAMECIDKLKQMGYTGEDVERAMGEGDMDSQAAAGGMDATKAAPMQIPGLK